ncbi:hypothetical protein [Megasphaera sp.]|uniref:hypothetical protein n=1 Tax=Megasphaera sp. TaxID=2023260 RepID=UPI004029A3A7
MKKGTVARATAPFFSSQRLADGFKFKSHRLKRQTSYIKGKENLRDNKKLYMRFPFFIENLRLLLYNKQVYSYIIHL